MSVPETQKWGPATHSYGAYPASSDHRAVSENIKPSSMASAMENRQLPRLALRPVHNLAHFQSDGPWSLPPIKTVEESESRGILRRVNCAGPSGDTSPTSPSHGPFTTLAHWQGRVDASSRTLTPESMVKQEHHASPESDSSVAFRGPASQHLADEYAQRYSLLPDSGPIIPPIYQRGMKVEIKQKQNCGRRVQAKDWVDPDDSDPSKKRRQTEHTNAERNRRNDHKNLLKDLHEQIPNRFLEESGWQDKSKEPNKKMIMESAVRYILHMSREFTLTLDDRANLEHKFGQLQRSHDEMQEQLESQKRVNAQQANAINELTRKADDTERRPSVASSKGEYVVPDLSMSASFRSEPPTPDGQEMCTTMEPRIPASGPPTPAFSMRSSPLPRSQPVSRPGSPTKLGLPGPILSNNDFHFPNKPKRKPDEPGWVKINHDDCTDLSQTSPKRVRV